MVIKRVWTTRKKGQFFAPDAIVYWDFRDTSWEGWFFLGIIPLYIRPTGIKYHD